MLILRWLLLPFTILYTLIIWVRNQCYDLGILTSKTFPVNTVVIGNLAVGGAGKSPLVQLLVDKLQADYRLATLSRGYGRKTKGFRLVQVSDSVEHVGDEPLQLKKKHPNITVAVDENRAEGIEILQKEHNLILLDDAFQHRKVKPTCSILLFEYYSLLKPILLLPTGNFRDGFNQTKRADIILITKCPENISKENKDKIERKIRKQNKTAEIFYSYIVYKPLRPLTVAPAIEDLTDHTVILFTGIANPKPLEGYLSKQGIPFIHIAFPDHHNYSNSDYNKVLDAFKSVDSNRKIILTTEKDAQRLDLAKFSNIPLYYIPIETRIDQETRFLSKLDTLLNHNS
ncbi:tetraacyldisaccharide 4'-kinase [Sphingobacterium sp. DK4209]|uniref:Tetraacyldisaccharide 4'-kinase n=1 Tax=Sphingobacterium zhuxiongii TaxID=2662364 RepID=A0A5Q0QAW7_9SPHI|nr:MULTISPECIES: tetraacyldisaccharide 4'-kinase [unclassified Sphingobacterium]MVZ65849.1 tetraacyldisaccharide 4'-kinase [Sphingobacterium sp. DK4209]QGA24808.1 tetraacyldisaccharide 4'-kinase [Sphingobacterium sp. dk4302]